MSNPELIVYDASDGIENALYPSRWVSLSNRPEHFEAVKKSCDSLLSFLFDDITRPIEFGIKLGDTVIPMYPFDEGTHR